MQSKKDLKTVSKKSWLALFLALILIVTVTSMIIYQYNRRDPVTVKIRNAQGFETTQIVYKQPNETVRQVVSRVANPNEYTTSYVCDYPLEEKVSAIKTLRLDEMVTGTIHVDGKDISYVAGAESVEDVLTQNGITLNAQDIVNPPLNSIVSSSNNDITINRVESKVIAETEVIPFGYETVENDQAAFNERTTLRSGKNGIRSYTEEVIYIDGVEAERHVTSDQQTAPVNELVQIGTNLTVGKPNIEKGDIESWRPYVIKALQENGLDTSDEMVDKVLRQINTESAGDQNAHQEIVDMNTYIGQEARGLMQTIPYTFDAYHHPGYDDILNGYHNLLAALSYAKERYGPSLWGLGNLSGY